MHYSGLLALTGLILAIVSIPGGAIPVSVENSLLSSGLDFQNGKISSIVFPEEMNPAPFSPSDLQNLMINREPHAPNLSLAMSSEPSGISPLSRLTPEEIAIGAESQSGLAETGMKAMGTAVVLVPITPTPSGEGYSYRYPESDSDYWIYAPGDYALGSEITQFNPTSIIITAPEVSLDGKGYTITGNGSGTGINETNSNVTISNFSRISGFTNGIKVSGKNVRIVNNSVTGNIYGIRSNNNSTHISDLIADKNSKGIVIFGSHGIIQNSRACNNSDVGIIAIFGSENSIRNNVVNNNTYESILITSKNTEIRNNTVNNNGGGIASIGDGVTIADNIINSNQYEGIWSYADNATIYDNIIINNSESGIFLRGNESIVSGNTLYSNPNGINSTDLGSMIVGNSISGSSANGIMINGRNTTVLGNSVNQSTYGIGIGDSADGAHIAGNTISYVAKIGIWSFSPFVEIADNILNNGKTGIYFGNQNVTIRNNFIRNYSNVGIGSYDMDSFIANNIIQNCTTGIEPWGTRGVVINNTVSGSTICGIRSFSDNHTIMSNVVYGNQGGINATTSGVIIRDNNASGNINYGISLQSSDAIILNNTVVNNTLVGFFSHGDNNSFTGNNASKNMIGMINSGNNSIITQNTLDGNRILGGVFEGNRTFVHTNHICANMIGGFEVDGSHPVISGNTITDNKDSGIFLGATDVFVNDNLLDSNQHGVFIYNSLSNLVFTGNILRNNTEAAIYLDNASIGSNGSIYNNYFGNLKVMAGAVNASQFVWTNPAGPEPGISVVGGPFIAGNYWSNATGTGWSDQQPPNSKGYTTIPYEVAPGAYDTAPLVKTGATPTPTPTPGSLVANFTADQVIGLPPLSVRFIDLSSGYPTKWRWNFGDGSFSLLQNPSHTYNGIGRYTITLEVWNPDASSIVRKIEFIKTVRYLKT